MKLKDKVYAKCSCCDQRTELISEEEFGCDNCQSPIGENVLRVEVFYNTENGSAYYGRELCSWKCVFEFLPTINTNCFVSLPHLSFDDVPKGQTVADFWQAVKDFAL